MTRDQEALTILMEECGEVIQAASKIIRFDKSYDDLEVELGDLICIMRHLVSTGKLDFIRIHKNSIKKREKLAEFSNLFKRTDI